MIWGSEILGFYGCLAHSSLAHVALLHHLMRILTNKLIPPQDFVLYGYETSNANVPMKLAVMHFLECVRLQHACFTCSFPRKFDFDNILCLSTVTVDNYAVGRANGLEEYVARHKNMQYMHGVVLLPPPSLCANFEIPGQPRIRI